MRWGGQFDSSQLFAPRYDNKTYTSRRFVSSRPAESRFVPAGRIETALCKQMFAAFSAAPLEPSGAYIVHDIPCHVSYLVSVLTVQVVMHVFQYKQKTTPHF